MLMLLLVMRDSGGPGHGGGANGGDTDGGGADGDEKERVLLETLSGGWW